MVIALKELLSSLSEMDADAPELGELPVDEPPLLLLPHAAMSRAAAPAATAVRPALEIEYNVVPRLSRANMRWHGAILSGDRRTPRRNISLTFPSGCEKSVNALSGA